MLFLLLLLLLSCMHYDIIASQQFIEVVSIIDANSALSCLIKLHSIITNARKKSSYSFKFLIIDNNSDNPLSVDKWNTIVRNCFDGIRIFSKLWQRPEILAQYLSGESFEVDAIYARFYLPHLFPTLKRFIYIDNDCIVTEDLQKLFVHHLAMPLDLNDIPAASTIPPKQFLPRHRPITLHRRRASGQIPTPVGFVFEKHSFYGNYLADHFNSSHPLVASALSLRDRDIFFNAGVFLMDASLWRKLKLTTKAEQIISENNQCTLNSSANSSYQNDCAHPLYSPSVGDQGAFFLLLLDRVSYLPQRFNMRRLPKKTISMLDNGQTTGIVHLAGSIKGDPVFLCRYPLLYPMFLHAVVPLYLSVINSFLHSCPQLEYAQELQSLCIDYAAPAVSEEIKKQGIRVNYNPGNQQFSWPINI